MLEREVEATLVSGVRKLGGQTFKLIPVAKGLPDRLVVLPGGRVFFVELKTVTGRASSAQRLWQSRLLRIGADVRTLYGKDQVQSFLSALEEEPDE